MNETAFVDASPLILLAATGRLELLRCAAVRIVVPAAVERETLARADDDAAALALRQADWLERCPDPDVPAEVTAWDLGAGESSVLGLAAQTPGAIAVIDDLAARRCSASLGIRMIGTLGVVVRARRLGPIPAARPAFEALRAAGLYVSDGVIERALREIGE